MSAKDIELEVVGSNTELPAVRQRSGVLLMPVMDLNTAKARLLEFEQFCAHYLSQSEDGGNDGGDYGVIPGTKKKTLLKSGSDKLCELYGLYDEYQVLSTVEDWEKGLFDYTLKCILKSRRDDSMVGAGVGSCSSWESKYRWRDSKRVCPKCSSDAIIKGKEEYGGGWICFAKKGGCGAKFTDKDPSIIGQVLGRVENPDIIDAKNTVLKMAKKRAKIDAVIGVTRSSGIFTQDMDDVPMPPTKPPVERTTEPIPLKPKAEPRTVPETDADALAHALTDAIIRKMEPQPENFYEKTKAAVAEKQATPVEEPTFPGCIDKNRKVAFARAWKDAVPKEFAKQAEALRADWLGRRGYVDDNGNPTSGCIKMEDFEEVKRDAILFAKGLK
jgi:hypothetical protein